jgi:dihydrofolate reductase
VVSRQIAAIAPNPNYPNALFWNPTGATLEQALAHLEVTDGIVAIIGGTGVFSMFLPRYDAFHLSHAAHAKIPGGRPVFAAVGPHATPEDVLMQHGLKPGPRRELDPAAGVSEVTWTR